jgi:hypothetical protein
MCVDNCRHVTREMLSEFARECETFTDAIDSTVILLVRTEVSD